ncbi:hypothetical protein QMK19_14975 [Streptomyces sp. H10-C2]|uniref:hypothetical protein n=1 Tax=unclassified Streptomyces TaxID=2593676 RepID=UPI0024B8786E|nr:MULTISPECIES: hypothetical protein [unclassified Streptomyces]MDJ0341357.1 hypothetical protein [Streptomyces sp. PH10-H1]MDJ0370952.1 hypothetical protein [Streptomyces sp. H10-C2]
MTQPPPPPGNPPNFGKPEGAVPPPPQQAPPPQGPPPGQPPQYGYPQTALNPQAPQGPPPGQAPQGPPPQPQYGYPQTPPAGQVPDNPYAQPVPPGQNPYAQQQPPQQPQQQYGYPQAPPPGQPPQYGYPPNPPPGGPQTVYTPPPGQGGGSGGNGRLITIIAAVVAAVLVIGGGVWFATKGDDGKELPEAKKSSAGTDGGTSSGGNDKPQGLIHAKVGWTATAQRPPLDEITARVPNAWFTGDTFVKTMPDSIKGYVLNGGKEKWSIPITGKSCPASDDASNDRVVIQFGANCELLMAVDIAKGTKLWEVPLPIAPGSTSTAFIYSQVAVSGDVAAVSWIHGSAAYKISTHEQIWAPVPSSKCQDKGYAGGKQLLAVVACEGTKEVYVQGIDPTTYKKTWSWQVSAGTELSNIVSTDPVVIGIGASNSLMSDLMYLENGKLVGHTSLGNGGYEGNYGIHCRMPGEGRCFDFAIDGTTLYTPTKTHKADGASYGQTNEIAAIDLKTGKPLWTAKPDVAAETTVVAIENGKVIAYQKSTYDKPGGLYAMDPKTQKNTPYMKFASDTQKTENDFLDSYSYQWLHNGHFLLTATSISAKSDLTDKAIADFS